MLKSRKIRARRRPPSSWRKSVARIRQLRVTETEQDGERSLETALHWRDPVERLRALRRRYSHVLVEDNPATG
jgi:hypothetical protein